VNPEDFQDSTAGSVKRTSEGYWAFIPNPLPPMIQWSPALITSLGEAERSLGKLDSLAKTLPSPHILVRQFVRREAVLSSRIEGTRASMSDVYAYEAAMFSFLDPDTDAGEVHNYVRALDYGIAVIGSNPISLELIREIHKQLMTGVAGSHIIPGEFRLSQNWIGPAYSTLATAVFVPPPIVEMNNALSDLVEFILAPSDIPILARSAMIHYQFEAIHPFLDGNGRIGRLLVVLLLIQWKLLSRPWLYLSAYFEANRWDYYERLLAVSQRGVWEEWLFFFFEGVQSQCEDAIRRIESLHHLQEAYQKQLRGERAFGRLMQAIDILFERPILTIRQLEAAMGVPYRSAQRYIEKLVASGILREVSGRARNRIYQADEVLSAIEDPPLGTTGK
jgi:cell filamentation protein, protein adenylyltransferase